MTDILNSIPASGGNSPLKSHEPVPAEERSRSELGIKFEKMLWAEMLRHTGLEKAVTQSGGQGSAAFAQFMVEAIAEDIARRNPLGLEPAGLGDSAPVSVDASGANGDE